MSPARHVPTALLLTALVALAPAAAASAQTAQPRIKAGITAGGVDVSGLTVPEAAAKLESVLTPHLSRGLVLGVGGRVHRLDVADAKLALDAERTAKRALYARAGTASQAGAAGAATEVPLAIVFSRAATRDWVQGIARQAYRAPRNATLSIGLRKMTLKRARTGLALDVARTRALVDAALADGDASRVMRVKLSRVSPAVNANDLRARHRTIVTVSQGEFRLRIFKNLKFSKAYGVAVGQPAYPTPRGTFSITNKAVNPVWTVPNSPWAGELQGTSVEGGSAANPLKARWLGIVNGVGIHGTGEEWSIGSRASHGCIRMRVADVIDLYPRVPVGTTVKIG